MMFSPMQVAERRRYLESLENGTAVKETITKQTRPKSQQQLGAHFGLALQRIIEAFNDMGWDSSMILNLPKPTGTGTTKGMLQEFFYALFPVFDEGGKRKTMRDFSTAEESKFYEQINSFASSQWGIYIPDPNLNWKDKPDQGAQSGKKGQNYGKENGEKNKIVLCKR